MSSSDFSQKPGFWLLFFIILIVGLFVYGYSKMKKEATAISISVELVNTKKKLSDCNTLNSKKQQELADRDKLISENKQLIDRLRDSMQVLANRPPDTIVRYQENDVYKDRIVYRDRDRIVYRDRPEPYHIYGKGNGKITLFKKCNCENLYVWVDGIGLGYLYTAMQEGDCSSPGTISKFVPIGIHRIHGKDSRGHSWYFNIQVTEDNCSVSSFTLQSGHR